MECITSFSASIIDHFRFFFSLWMSWSFSLTLKTNVNLNWKTYLEKQISIMHIPKDERCGGIIHSWKLRKHINASNGNWFCYVIYYIKLSGPTFLQVIQLFNYPTWGTQRLDCLVLWELFYKTRISWNTVSLTEKAVSYLPELPIGRINTHLRRLALDSSTDGFHSLLFSPCFFVSSGDLISENRFSKPICDKKKKEENVRNRTGQYQPFFWLFGWKECSILFYRFNHIIALKE